MLWKILYSCLIGTHFARCFRCLETLRADPPVICKAPLEFTWVKFSMYIKSWNKIPCGNRSLKLQNWVCQEELSAWLFGWWWGKGQCASSGLGLPQSSELASVCYQSSVQAFQCWSMHILSHLSSAQRSLCTQQSLEHHSAVTHCSNNLLGCEKSLYIRKNPKLFQDTFSHEITRGKKAFSKVSPQKSMGLFVLWNKNISYLTRTKEWIL